MLCFIWYERLKLSLSDRTSYTDYCSTRFNGEEYVGGLNHVSSAGVRSRLFCVYFCVILVMCLHHGPCEWHIRVTFKLLSLLVEQMFVICMPLMRLLAKGHGRALMGHQQYWEQEY